MDMNEMNVMTILLSKLTLLKVINSFIMFGACLLFSV